MTSITKAEIKARSTRLWEIMNTLRNINRRGYRLWDECTYDYDSNRYVLGERDFWLEYSDKDGDHMLHYFSLTGEVSDLSGYSREGNELVESKDEGLKSMLKEFAKDRRLYEIVKAAEYGYDDKVRVKVDTCISPMDTENMRDGYYTETTFTVNSKGSVYESKPREYSRSVLVALNID